MRYTFYCGTTFASITATSVEEALRQMRSTFVGHITTEPIITRVEKEEAA